MGVWSDLYHGRSDIDFPRLWPKGLVLSLLMVVLSIGSLATRELHLGIDFEGGVSWELPAPGVSVSEARDALHAEGLSEAKIQTVEVQGEDRRLRIQAGPQSEAKTDEVTKLLAELADTSSDEVSVSTVGPSWGDSITDAAVRALIWFLVVISLYITVRLEWRMAAGALVAVIHDIVISVGVYSVLQFEVTPGTVIAFLTILGYSLYDTIVVYDKVHENTRRGVSRGDYAAVMSRSMNQVIMRSINTTTVALLPVISMLVVGAGIMGAVTLREFSLALLVGLLSGAYSSVFVASPVVVWLHRRSAALPKVSAPERDRTPARVGAAPRPKGASSASTPAGEAASPPAAPSGPFTHPPRPRKKGRRR